VSEEEAALEQQIRSVYAHKQNDRRAPNAPNDLTREKKETVTKLEELEEDLGELDTSALQDESEEELSNLPSRATTPNYTRSLPSLVVTKGEAKAQKSSTQTSKPEPAQVNESNDGTAVKGLVEDIYGLLDQYGGEDTQFLRSHADFKGYIGIFISYFQPT
jgi:hypothetical protein